MEEKKNNPKIIINLIFAVLGFFIGYLAFSNSNSEDYNSKMLYGDSGLPKNCRAIIAENVKAFRSGEFLAEEAIESIDRNCGELGYAWEKY